MNCRLCDQIITGRNGLMLYDYNENVETLLGRKISIILNSKGTFENLSNYCCSICSYKIEICFSLLVEIQASHEVIKQTYENLAKGKQIDTASQLFICEECNITVSGLKAFTQHYESHVLKKTTDGSKKDVPVSEMVMLNSEERKASLYTSEDLGIPVNSGRRTKRKEENLSGMKLNLEETDSVVTNESANYIYIGEEFSELNKKDDDNDKDDCGGEDYDDNDHGIDDEEGNEGDDDDDDDDDDDGDGDGDDDDDDDDENDDNNIDEYYYNYEYDYNDDSDNLQYDYDTSNDSDSDLSLGFPSEFSEIAEHSAEELIDDKYGKSDSGVQMVGSEFDEFDGRNNEKVGLNDSDSLDAQSESSFSSDLSYTNLVNIVKKELEKSDSEDDSLDVAPDKNGNYSCETCNISFEFKFMLKLHLDKNHQAFHNLDVESIKNIIKNLDENYNPLLKCYYCKMSIPTSEIKEHVMWCRNVYYLNRKMICQVCGKLFCFRDLEKHVKEHSQIVWACEKCGQKFKAKRFLLSHLGKHDESKKKICEICGKKLLPLSFFSHIMKHREKRHVCQYCGKAFTYNYGLRIHMRVHDNKKLEDKPEKKRDKIFCWLCKKDFDCTIALNEHLKNDHNAEGVEQDSRFPCGQCNKKFADMFSLKAHLKLIHEMKDEDIARLKSLPVYRYIECNVCFKVFNSENKIRIHMKQDHGLKPFEMEILKKECEKCGKKFASKQNLIHHINGAHLHIKPMTCDICQEKFAKHSSLIYHKLRHSGEKPFQCEFCQKSYRQRNDVIRHLARHVRDKELTLEEASAVNNSPSRLVIKRRIFLKDSSINYKTIVKKSRRKSDIVKMEPILDEEINEIQEEQMEFNENGMSDPMIYVEEVPVEENQTESPSGVTYMDAKPVYDEERNTIILSSPDVMKNSVKNVTYRYIPSLLKHMPAVIVKKQEQI